MSKPAKQATRERPILMHARSINGILAGRKTQTRRIIKGPPADWAPIVGIYAPTKVNRAGFECPGPETYGASDESYCIRCAYGQPGDRLWVRETWCPATVVASTEPGREGQKNIYYRASVDAVDEKIIKGHWRPSIYMPRAYCRLILEVTSVRAQRVQEISEEGVLAEGVESWDEWDAHGQDCQDYYRGATEEDIFTSPQEAFKQLWNNTNGKDAWKRNDWVWVVKFKRVEE